MNTEEIGLAELVLEDQFNQGVAVSFGAWKRQTEDLIGREMSSIEATTAYDMITLTGGRTRV